jgi:hypothetical protein
MLSGIILILETLIFSREKKIALTVASNLSGEDLVKL